MLPSFAVLVDKRFLCKDVLQRQSDEVEFQFFKDLFFKLYIICVCVGREYVHLDSRRRHWIPWSWSYSYEPPNMGNWELNVGPLKEHCAFVITEQLLQPSFFSF